MVIFGGLEFVVGGYLIHRHYKAKEDKKKKQDGEAWGCPSQRRNYSYPGVDGRRHDHHDHRDSRCRPYHLQDRPSAQQKHAYYAAQSQTALYQPQRRHQAQGHPQAPARRPVAPHQGHQRPPARPQPHAPPQSTGVVVPYARPTPGHTLPQPQRPFLIPRRPVPTRRPQQPQPRPQTQPVPPIQPLQRADSMATLSGIPVANGSAPSDLRSSLSPPRQPYQHHGYTVSTPALPVFTHRLDFDDIDDDDISTVYTPSQMDDLRRGTAGGARRYSLEDPPPAYQP